MLTKEITATAFLRVLGYCRRAHNEAKSQNDELRSWAFTLTAMMIQSFKNLLEVKNQTAEEFVLWDGLRKAARSASYACNVLKEQEDLTDNEMVSVFIVKHLAEDMMGGNIKPKKPKVMLVLPFFTTISPN